MMIEIVKTHLKRWRTSRAKQWQQRFEREVWSAEERSDDGEQLLLNREAIFMGDRLEVDPLSEGARPIDFFELSPHQCRQNWQEWLALALQQHNESGADCQKFSDYLRELLWEFCYYSGNLYSGLPLAQEMFDLVIGKQRDINDYHFMGQWMPHPYAPGSKMARSGAYRILEVLEGRGYYDALFKKQYPYIIQAVSYCDSDIFYPESVVDDESVNIKIAWARVFHALYHPDEERYVHRQRGGARSLKLIPELKKQEINVFRKSKQFIACKKRLLSDLSKGVLPDSMKELNHWAKAPKASYSNLVSSSEESMQERYPYIDPWTEPDEEEFIPEEEDFIETEIIVEPVLTVGEVVAACEMIRKTLHKNRVPKMSHKLKCEEDLRKLLRELGWSSKKKIDNEIMYRQHDPDWPSFLKMMCHGYWAKFFRADFFDGANVNLKDHVRYLTDNMKEFRKLVKGIVDIESVKVEKKVAFKERRLTLKIKVKQKTYTYEYDAEDWGLGDYFLDDLSELLKTEKAPWILHYDDEYEFLYYLPKGCGSLLVNPNWSW